MPHARESSSRSPSPSSAGEDFYLEALAREKAEGRSLRRALWAAVAAHALLLAVTLPEMAPRTLAAEAEPTVYVMPSVRFKKPPPPSEVIPRPRARRVPIPAPDPDRPEIFVVDVAEVQFDNLDFDPDQVFTVPDPPPAPPAVPDLLRVGGEVAPPVRVHYVEPRYSEIARRARIEGVVILQATIDREGRVTDLETLKGLPYGLTEAALAAVRQWRFEPSVHQGRPVPVLYVVSVHFQLSS